MRSYSRLPLCEDDVTVLLRRENQLSRIDQRLRKKDGEHSGLATVAEIKRVFADVYPVLEEAVRALSIEL